MDDIISALSFLTNTTNQNQTFNIGCGEVWRLSSFLIGFATILATVSEVELIESEFNFANCPTKN